MSLSGFCYGQQLFALRIDKEIKRLALRNHNAVGFGQEIELEYETIIELIYFYFSLMKGIPTPGMKLLNLQLIDKPKGNYKLLLLCIISAYLFKRIKKYILICGWQRENSSTLKYKLWRCLKLIDIISKTLGFANFLSFLYNGFYPSIQYRIAGYNVMSETKFTSSLNSVQQYVQARQVLWQLLLSLLVATSTAIDWQEMQYRLQMYSSVTLQYIRSLSVTQYISRFIEHRRGRLFNNASNETQTINILPDTCVACNSSPPEQPHIGECGHLFCYVCLQIGLLSTTENINRGRNLNALYCCPSCSQPISECNRKTN